MIFNEIGPAGGGYKKIVSIESFNVSTTASTKTATGSGYIALMAGSLTALSIDGITFDTPANIMSAWNIGGNIYRIPFNSSISFTVSASANYSNAGAIVLYE